MRADLSYQICSNRAFAAIGRLCDKNNYKSGQRTGLRHYNRLAVERAQMAHLAMHLSVDWYMFAAISRLYGENDSKSGESTQKVHFSRFAVKREKIAQLVAPNERDWVQSTFVLSQLSQVGALDLLCADIS